MFEFVEDTSRLSLGKRLLTLFISIAAHIVALVVIVVLPLVFFNVLPESELLTFLIAPPPPPPPPPPPAPTRSAVAQKVVVDPAKFIAPTELPKEIPPPIDEPPVVGLATVAQGVPLGVPGGIPGGVPGGVPGSVLGVVSPPPTPPPPPRPVKRTPQRVGGNVQAAKLIHRVEPVYPELAKRARISGGVFLEVTVDEEGNVSEVKILRGHPLLNDEVVRAVKQWKYSPTLLNGEPVPVVATVTVIFNLR